MSAPAISPVIGTRSSAPEGRPSTGGRPDGTARGERSRWDLAVLDLVGTLVEDDGVIEQSVRKAVERVAAGRAFSRGRVVEHRGASKRDLFKSLVPGRCDEATEIFHRELSRLISAARLPPRPGAEDALRALRDDGIGVCVVTGLAKTIARELVHRSNLHPLVEAVLTAEEAGRGRPQPDLVLAAARRCGAGAMGRVVVCGDTANDLHAGDRAGVGLLVGVLGGAHDRARLEASPHHYIIDSIERLPALLAENDPG